MDSRKITTEPIELKDLMALASFKTLSNFDTSSIAYRSDDVEPLLEDVSNEFMIQFKENLKEYFETQKKLLITEALFDQTQFHQSED